MPLSRRQIYLRRRIVVGTGASLILAIAFYLPLTLLAPLAPTAAHVVPYQAPTEPAAALTWPAYGASAISAIGYPEVLASSGSSGPLPIASITKIITTLIVLEAKPLELGDAGPSITFTSKDVQLFHTYLGLNGKVEPVHSGLVLTEHDVLELTLVASANNYAASLVNWAFGSEAAFLPVAATWLKVHGLTKTSLQDCTGISPQNTSTAVDLLTLGKIALAQPIVAAIVATEKITIPSVGEIENTNTLLGENGVHGIKTGTLDEAGACLLFTADYTIDGETVTVIGVILGGADHPTVDADTVALLSSAKAAFHEVKLVMKGDVVATYSTDWDTTVSAVATEDSSVLVWGNTAVSPLVHARSVSLAKSGTSVGSVAFTVGSKKVSVPIELAKAIQDPGPIWRLTHPTELF
jgi:serine-type D-Ala-D-Ala carboxypeptidase (penicillin-binding protein 5/6)